VRRPRPHALAARTTEELGALQGGPDPVVALVPVGAIEPHGPHLGLGTDVAISEAACDRAADRLSSTGITALVAPALPFGVTECAARFPGAISVSAEALIAYLGAVIDGLLGQGMRYVCAVNNHLEPAHEEAVRAAVAARAPRAGVASPLDRRWARTLSDEFRRGACHAGRYETSIALACAPELVRDELRRGLPPVDISLSRALAAGVSDFAEMGLDRAYAGAPADASAGEGEELLDRLALMVETIVGEAVALCMGP
jgi:creatinine amidohydrolase